MIDTDSAVKTVNTSSNANTSNANTAAARGISFMQLWRREWQVKQQGAVQWLYPLVLFFSDYHLVSVSGWQRTCFTAAPWGVRSLDCRSIVIGNGCRWFI